MHEAIVCSLYENSKPYYRHRSIPYKIRPGWNEHVSQAHAKASEPFKFWVEAGKSRQGPELKYKKFIHARYKYAVCFVYRNEQAMRTDSLAKRCYGIMLITFGRKSQQ